MKKIEDFKNGQLLLFDKPIGWSSFDVVNKIRWSIRKKFKIDKIKVGHAGTLDPLSTGLLLIATGKMTKSIEKFQNQKKTYVGNFIIGSTTPSFDKETEINEQFATNHITKELIVKVSKDFMGEISQYPPIFSAIKNKGKPLYKYARAGKNVKLKSRKITVFNFNIKDIRKLDVSFEIECSKGTYIRSLVNDFGKKLNSGAHLTKLRRTKIGDHSIEKAFKIDDFIQLLK